MRILIVVLFSVVCSGVIAAEGVIYRSESCGCCKRWVEHMEAAGFKLEDHPTTQLDVLKKQLGIPNLMQACHTAVIDGYVVEGHVPASVVSRLLAERPDALGIAVPGMPAGSPGMEGPPPSDYVVNLIREDGSNEIYEQIKARSGR